MGRYRTIHEGHSSCDGVREAADRSQEQDTTAFCSLDLERTLEMIKSSVILFSNAVYEVQIGEMT